MSEGVPQQPGGVGIGSVVDGRYELKGRLGAGGFAVVYRGKHVQLGREVAIKVLDQRQSREDPTFTERFLREAQVAARMSHPNIVTIYDFGHAGPDQPYIAMELCEGHDLQAELSSSGPMAPERVFHLFKDVLDALTTGHGLGVVHKDLKPANLFLQTPGTKRETLKVLDFGVAQIDYHELSRLTDDGNVLGTPRYLAPEYVREQVVSPAIDVYQMALIIVECLTGIPVVDGNSYAVMMKHANGDLNLPPELLQGRVGEVFRKALAVEPTQRYPNAGAFYEAFCSIEAEFCALPPMARGIWATELSDNTIPIKFDFGTANIPAPGGEGTPGGGVQTAADTAKSAAPHIPARTTWPPSDGAPGRYHAGDGSGPHRARDSSGSHQAPSGREMLAFNPPQQESGKGKIALLILLIIAVLGAGGFGVWQFVIKPRQEAQNATAEKEKDASPQSKAPESTTPAGDKKARSGLSLSATPDGKKVPFAIVSEPPGATISIDGSEKGITPATVELREGGLFQVTLTHPDFEVFARTVEVGSTPGQQKLTATLVPVGGVAEAETPGADAQPKPKPKPKPKPRPRPDRDDDEKDDSGGGGFMVAP